MSTRLSALAVAGLFLCCAPLPAQVQMPDPRQMAGIPRPVDDLPDRSVSVRLIRGALSNNITNHPVEMHMAAGAGATRTASTDEGGRATFADLPSGAIVHAVAIVDGERLESQEFPVPARGGIRVMLVATPPGGASAGSAAPPAAPAQPGTVTLGGNTRFIVEISDDGLQMYYVLDIVNPAQAAVNTQGPLVFPLPAGAQGATVLEGSAPTATINGTRLTVTGPFQPGSTAVQMAFLLAYSSGAYRLTWRLPSALPTLGVVVRKIGDVNVESAQVANRQEITTPEGQAYFLLSGAGVPAGTDISLALSGLPHHSSWPLGLAVCLSVLILGVGIWVAFWKSDLTAVAGRRRQLQARREQLFGQLLRIEEQHRIGRLDAASFASRKASLVAQLERVYGELDASGGASGGGEGLAA